MPRGRPKKNNNEKTVSQSKQVIISAPAIKTVKVTLVGTAPYLSNKFSTRAKDILLDAMDKGDKASGKSKREAKNFDSAWKESIHYAKTGWAGIPATCFRQAMISACRLTDQKMTLAKLSIMIEPDGFDRDDGTPLVKITKGQFKKRVTLGRNAQGAPIPIANGKLDPGWEANLRISYDSDQFNEQSIANLIHRVGVQVGIGAGRNDSKTSCGIGAGSFLTKKSRHW